MEKGSASPISSPRIYKSGGGGGLVSCWGRLNLKLKLPWKRRRTSSYRPVGGGFRYDPLSYAQNFDDGNCGDDQEDEESVRHGFSARYAAPSSAKTLNNQ